MPRSRSVKDDETVEVTRPRAGRIRKIRPGLKIPENSIGSIRVNDFVGKDIYVFGETKPFAASEYLNKSGNTSGEKKDSLKEHVANPSSIFTIGNIANVTVCLAISPSYLKLF